MNLDKLYEILAETTAQLRNGPALQGTPEMVAYAEAGDFEKPAPVGVLEIYDMPAASDPAFEPFEKVDLHFVTIAVDKAKAEARRGDLIDILNSWPDPERLAGGPSYIDVGATIGDQGAAFLLFALGKVLGIWNVITPALLGATGAEADRCAGMGFIMCSGYRRDGTVIPEVRHG